MISLYPNTWQDLQDKVAEILCQCKFSVEITKKIKSIRSTIEVDVYAEEIIENRKYTIIFECKYWNSNIPQLHALALRTVVEDIGVNKAYLITTSDFQKGAIDSTGNTNVELITWEEFQVLYFKSWYINYFSLRLHEIIDKRFNPTAIQFFENFDLIEKGKFRVLIEQYNCLSEISNHFPHPIFKDLPNQFDNIENKLPLAEKMEKSILDEWNMVGCSLPNEIMNESNYSEFLRFLELFATPIYKELDKLDLHIEYD
jgi:hypothetical protein